jgi:putative membrane protein
LLKRLTAGALYRIGGISPKLRAMRVSTIVAWLLGVGLLVALVALNDPARVLGAVAALRFWLILIVLFHGVPLFFDVLAWQRLFQAPPRFAALYRIRWICEGVNGLFPVPHLGELLRAEQTRRIARPGEAGATVVVDLTLGVATELLFAALGLALFALLIRSDTLLRGLVIAVAVLGVVGACFYALQRAGIFTLTVAIAQRWSGPARRRLDLEDARALDGRIRALYGRRGRLLASAAWRFIGWLTGAGETWLILYALGKPVGIADAVMLESLSHAARTAAFPIPGGLGVQDGALLLLAMQLGLGAEAGLALSLAKRCRELALGAPALFAGYVTEARRLATTGEWRGAPPPA